MEWCWTLRISAWISKASNFMMKVHEAGEPLYFCNIRPLESATTWPFDRCSMFPGPFVMHVCLGENSLWQTIPLLHRSFESDLCCSFGQHNEAFTQDLHSCYRESIAVFCGLLFGMSNANCDDSDYGSDSTISENWESMYHPAVGSANAFFPLHS